MVLGIISCCELLQAGNKLGFLLPLSLHVGGVIVLKTSDSVRMLMKTLELHLSKIQALLDGKR